MHLTSLYCEHYKAFREPVEIGLAPLTVLLGKNNAGKSTLARLPLLLLGGLTSEHPEPIELDVEGVDFGGSTLDLVYGRSPHGAFTIGGRFVAPGENDSLALRAKVQQITSPSLGGSGEAEYSFVSKFIATGSIDLQLEWEGSRKHAPATYADRGPVQFEGLLPQDREIPDFKHWRDRFGHFIDHISYLGPLRNPIERDLRTRKARFVGLRGQDAPQLIAADNQLYQRVSTWYQEQMEGWRLELDHSGPVFSCVVRSGRREINLADTGQGFGQVLPVVVQQLQHRSDEPGDHQSQLDIVEHPELHLHPAAHAALADLYVTTIAEERGRVLVETHSENFVLRLRRRVAEGRISPDQIALYWIDEATDGTTSIVRPIEIGGDGSLDHWPQGVFTESYDEVRALRRAVRRRTTSGEA